MNKKRFTCSCIIVIIYSNIKYISVGSLFHKVHKFLDVSVVSRILSEKRVVWYSSVQYSTVGIRLGIITRTHTVHRHRSTNLSFGTISSSIPFSSSFSILYLYRHSTWYGTPYSSSLDSGDVFAFCFDL